jgi:predicted HD phosphohydrolase
VFGALFHDVGKLAGFNHGAVAAEIIQPFVREDVYNVIRFHQDFEGYWYFHFLGMDRYARKKHEGQPWYDLAAKFSDKWDMMSFDPEYDSFPLSHFEELVVELTEKTRREIETRPKNQKDPTPK